MRTKPCWSGAEECDACWARNEIICLPNESFIFVVLCTYFLITHPLFVHGKEETVGSLYWYFAAPSAIHAPSVLRKEKQNNKFLFAVFQKQFLRFFALLLVLPLWDFPSSISIFSVLIKLEHIFHGRDFGFARKNFIGNPFESDAVLVDAEQQESLFASENCALLTSGKSSSKKLDFNLV